MARQENLRTPLKPWPGDPVVRPRGPYVIGRAPSSTPTAAFATDSTRSIPVAIVCCPAESTATRYVCPLLFTCPMLLMSQRPVALRGIHPFFSAQSLPAADTPQC